METSKKFRNYQKACYCEWTGNRDNGEVRRHPSQRMDGKVCMFYLLQWKMICLNLRVLSPIFYCNQQQRNISWLTPFFIALPYTNPFTCHIGYQYILKVLYYSPVSCCLRKFGFNIQKLCIYPFYLAVITTSAVSLHFAWGNLCRQNI